jgi:prepilin-type processing-associated H-X9-DG protein
MDALWLLSNLVLWVGALALGFLLVGAPRALRFWTWRLEQLEVALSSRPQLWQAGRYVPGPFSVGGPWASNANPVTIAGASADGGSLGGGRVPSTAPTIGSRTASTRGGCNFLFADGSVHFLRAGMDIRVLATLATRAGGEVVPADGR